MERALLATVLGLLLSCGAPAPDRSPPRSPDDGAVAAQTPGPVHRTSRGETERERDRARCTGGDGEACWQLAMTEHDGKGVPKNDADALGFLTQACRLGTMKGCRGAAGLLIDEARPSDAIPLAEKACAAKFADSCYVLGVAIADAKQDYPRALGYLDGACRDDTLGPPQGIACSLSGGIVLGGRGMPRDARRGIAYFETACDHGYAAGCANAGAVYREGSNGVARDEAKGVRLLARACSLGQADACAAK